MENNITNQGNNNIIIQGITDSSITLQINGATQEIQNEMATLNALLEQMNVQQVQMADKIYDLGELGQADLGLKKTFNVLITKKLMVALAENGLVPAQKFLDKTKSMNGWENDNRFADVAKNLITFAFVGVIGAQLRKIMAIGKEALSEGKQQTYIQSCYLTSQKAIQLLNFTLISVFWDVQKTNNYELNEEETKELNLFFDDSIERNLADYATLLELLVNLFEKHQIDFPLKGLKDLNIERFKKTCKRIQKLQNSLEESQHSLMTCFEMEGQLTQFLTHLILFMNYDMLSVKSVIYDEKRTSSPKYIHSYIELGIDQKFNENTEKLNILNTPVVTDAVLIYDKRSNYEVYVNLSPFVIDYNTQMFEKGAKICFFSSKHISDASLNYRFLEDNSIENVNFSNMLNANTKLENLMKEKKDYIKLKFDLIFQQFEEAKKEVLKNSTQGESGAEDVSFDDLFG
ncbi:MAG: hypothetical protein JKY03_05225 [Aureispira sp.]|nr:hypothetical protein [Aureispira sp.]